VEVFPAFDKLSNKGKTAAIVGRKDGRAWRLAQQLGLEPQLFAARLKSGIVLVDSVDAYELVRAEVLEQARSGGTVVFLEQEPGSVWHVLDQQVRVARMPGKEFVSRKTGHPLIKNFQPFDFSYWYDREKDYIEYVATSSLDGGNLKPILISGENARAGDPYPVKRTLIVAGEMPVGKGSLIFTQLKAISRLETEPIAAAYFQALVDWSQNVNARN